MLLPRIRNAVSQQQVLDGGENIQAHRQCKLSASALRRSRLEVGFVQLARILGVQLRQAALAANRGAQLGQRKSERNENACQVVPLAFVRDDRLMVIDRIDVQCQGRGIER